MDIKKVIHKITPKKRVPIRVPIEYKYDIHRDEYLMALMDRLEKKGKSLDSDMYDKL